MLQWPTYRTFIKLLDNYESGTGQAEVVTAEEEQENWAFINACMHTKVYQHNLVVIQFPSVLLHIDKALMHGLNVRHKPMGIHTCICSYKLFIVAVHIMALCNQYSVDEEGSSVLGI